MNLKVQFTDLADRASKMTLHSDKILVEEQNLTEGNFLIFSDVPRVEDKLDELLTIQYTSMLKQNIITADKIKNTKYRQNAQDLAK